MEWHCIRSTSDFLASEAHWNELVENGVTRHTYLTHEWFRAWWDAFGTDKELSVIVASEGERWMAVAPLCISERAVGPLRLRCLQFMFSAIGPRCEFILRGEDPAAIAAALDGMMSASDRWTYCCLDAVSEQSVTARLFPASLRERGITFDVAPHRASPALRIQGSWDKYLAALSQSRRRHIRRAWRKIDALGHSVLLRRITDHDELIAYLPKLFDVSSRSWKGREGCDMGATAVTRQFYSHLSDKLSRKSKLVVWSLEVDGNSLAMMFCLHEERGVIGMLSDFDDDYRKLGPGDALIGYVLKDCFDRGMVEYDFGGAAYGYKLHYADHIRRHFTFEIYPPGFAPALLRLARRANRRLRRKRRWITALGNQGGLPHDRTQITQVHGCPDHMRTGRPQRPRPAQGRRAPRPDQPSRIAQNRQTGATAARRDAYK